MRSYAILAVAASVAGPAFVSYVYPYLILLVIRLTYLFSAYPVQFGGIVAREATTQTNVNQHAAPHPDIYNHQPDEHGAHSSAHPHELNAAHEHEPGHYEPTEHNAVHPNHAARPYHRNGQHAAAAESHLRTGEHAEKYETFWRECGRALKEGLLSDQDNTQAILEASSFASTHDPEKLTTLADYVARMPEGQESIYYVTGESRASVENSPHIEAFRAKGYEVLLLTDQDRKSTRLNSSHSGESRMPSSA